jgi:hypothetical protein
MMQPREPDNKKTVRAKLKLQLDLLAICIFFMACVDMLLFFLMSDALRLAVVIPLVAGSCMITLLLYGVLHAFFLRPLFKLHSAIGRTLITGLHVTENKSGDGNLYSELHGMFNYLAESLHDSEAGLSASAGDTRSALLSRLTDEFRDPLQKTDAAPDLSKVQQTFAPRNVLSGKQNTESRTLTRKIRARALPGKARRFFRPALKKRKFWPGQGVNNITT